MDKTEVGNKYVLWQVDYILDAYKDQFGYSHPAYIVKDVYIVTVTEERYVKGVWGSGYYIGVKGLTGLGKNAFRNWHSYPDDSMCPDLYWTVEIEKDHSITLVDAEQFANYNLCLDKNRNRAEI